MNPSLRFVALDQCYGRWWRVEVNNRAVKLGGVNFKVCGCFDTNQLNKKELSFFNWKLCRSESRSNSKWAQTNLKVTQELHEEQRCLNADFCGLFLAAPDLSYTEQLWEHRLGCQAFHKVLESCLHHFISGADPKQRCSHIFNLYCFKVHERWWPFLYFLLYNSLSIFSGCLIWTADKPD